MSRRRGGAGAELFLSRQEWIESERGRRTGREGGKGREREGDRGRENRVRDVCLTFDPTDRLSLTHSLPVLLPRSLLPPSLSLSLSVISAFSSHSGEPVRGIEGKARSEQGERLRPRL